MLHWLIAPLIFAAAAPVPAPPGTASLELVDDSFSSPLYVTAPSGDSRLFVVERGGAVKLVIDDRVVGTYLDIGSLLPASPGSEQGLLSMAFHPEFAGNGLLYLAYTDSSGALVVAELTADPAASSVNTADRRTIIRVPQPAANHNGGMILFGPDDLLYLALGDGGGGGDPQGNGQNVNTLLGSILRLDVSGDDFPADASRNYSIPAGNPFVGSNGADEIWVYGLRNPWRFWIDPPSGRMYIADVGQSEREEVTILEPGAQPGANLGWDRLEGSRCYPSGGTCSTSGTVLPQVEYLSGAGSTSVTGGMVYRGSKVPSLRGTYFYADFVNGWVRSLQYTGTVNRHYIWNQFPTSLVSSFGVDGHGEMYVVSLAGSVWRIVGPPNEEIFFYRSDGAFRFYDIAPDATLGSPVLSGSGYAPNWEAITAVDVDGDGNDEMLFYRSAQGTYRYYDVRPNATIVLMRAGTGYSHKWNSISSVDLDGDGQDEIFFYDRDLGLFAYYDIRPDATLGAKTYTGNYSTGWDSITAVDLDGDQRDEMLFYRQDGTFRYYRMRPDGRFLSLLASGTGYSTGWNSITAIDLDGDHDDELLFYRNDGTFKYYRTSNTGVGALITSGTGYSDDWTSITGIDLG
jgi:glucose/arabinose dehydrogenase